MKLIPLSTAHRGKVVNEGYFARVDDEDYERLIKYRWSVARKEDGRLYALRSFTNSEGKKTTQKMHRFILGITDLNIVTDHINNDGLDNTRSNIRACTRSQNMANRTAKKNGSSKYLGVYLQKSTKRNARKDGTIGESTWIRWSARIATGGVQVHLGSFKDEIMAAKAYNNAAIKTHGEFARLNEV